MPNSSDLNPLASFPLGSSPAAQLAAILKSRGKNPVDEELQALLHRRLRSFSGLACLGITVLAIRTALVFRSLNPVRASSLVILGAAAISIILTTLYVNLRKDIPLRLLRRAELVILFMGTLAVGFWGYMGMLRGAALGGELPSPLASFISSHSWALLPGRRILLAESAVPLAAPVAVNFGFGVVLYGILIPNTWRRCAGFLAAMVVIAAFVPVLASFSVAALRPMLPRLIYAIVSVITLYSLVGLYGCHKLDASRKQVYAAREVGPYRLVRRIGRGGMGEVFLARHKLLRRPCAIKMVHPEQAESRDRLARFELEVQAMSLLTHPNTVEIYDYGHTQDGTFYYAMEFLPGFGLDQLVRYQGALPVGRALYLLRQVGGALGEAHMKGLIHRDR